ncbi:flagellar motor protein PomA [Mangrovimicrobium sediminis]|uniref:Flagellar motor protein PomA n=1 Tax=Mangrovimicrobium sediminis TaxID=2562682 RepID=A0A4Z0LU59_9GAMM|nr:flagellar motor protein PomA [Haliea sp. SAOS-164]TGD70832.1 flagellar motor protein PomA [Haliea sp. SAOS-164]
MDLATLIGMIGASVIVGLAIIMGGSALMFINIPSLLIVIGGTFLVVMIKFSLKDFLNAFKVATRAFKFELQDPQELIETIIEMSKTARKEGVLALEKMEIENQFLKDAVMMMVDGLDRDTIKARMAQEIKQTIDRHTWGAKVFFATADVAPAMGMIGTLIGLVQMLANMEDPKAIGPAMAVALLTTLYGAVLANVVAKPIGDKLTLRRSEESRNKSLCLDGIMAIQEGLNYRLIESLLEVYLTPGVRQDSSESADGAAAEAA